MKILDGNLRTITNSFPENLCEKEGNIDGIVHIHVRI